MTRAKKKAFEENLMPTDIKIKGIIDGLLITIGEGEWSELQPALISHIDNQKDFLQGARVTLDVGNQILKAAELGHLRDLLSERDIHLRAILSHSPTTERTAQALGLATKLSKPRPERTTRKMDTSLQGDHAILIKKTLRSGHSLKHAGHVIVIGDVNPGAEIVAGGNVVVWGRLRGTVHAGANGQENAIVCALDLSPTQLRIADQISITPPQRRRPKPEMAYLENGVVVAEAWKFKR